MTFLSSKRARIATKTRKGLFLLSSRTLITNILQIISSLVLAKLLIPYDYSIFGILNNWINSLSYFSDVGLHESLIQQKESISKKHIQNYLGLRLTLSMILSVLFALLILFFKDYLEIKENNLLFYFLGFLTFFDVLSSVPKIFLQKDLDFSRLAKLETIATTCLYFGQILFASLGFSYWCFFIGVFLRTFIVISFGIKNKMFSFPSFKVFKNLKGYLQKGIFFQLNLIIVAIHTILTPLVLKSFLPLQEIGLIYWVTGLVSIPTSFINNFHQTLFPAIAKLQSEEEEIIILMARANNIILFLTFFIFGLGTNSGGAILLNIFDKKWHAGVSILPFIAISIGLYNLRTIPNVILAGVGTPQKRTHVELGNTLLFLISTFYFGNKFGLNGYLWSLTITSIFSMIFSYIKIFRYLTSETIRRFFIFLIASAVSIYGTFYFGLHKSILNSSIFFICGFTFISTLFDKKIIFEVRDILIKLPNKR